MALEIGDVAADFDGKLASGETVKLSELLRTGPVVLFFYPKAFTPGCTAESCRFRDLEGEFKALGATPVGISSDSVEDQQNFASQYSLPFPLIADEDGSIAKAFGTKRPGLPFDRRVTFVIDKDRKIIQVIKSERDMDVHADDALAALRQSSPDLAAN